MTTADRGDISEVLTARSARPMSDPVLDGLLEEALPTPKPVALWPSGAARGVQKVHYTHDAMVDLIIAEPTISQNSLAAHFGYTAGWVSQVIASDAFQSRLAERTSELVDPTIRATVEERFKALVLRSLDILREKLDKPSASIPDQLVVRSLELSSRAMGYGARENPPAAPAVNMHVHLESLGEGLTQLLRRKKSEVFDQENSDDAKEA